MCVQGESREKNILRFRFFLIYGIPIPSMYGIFTYIWLFLMENMVNVGKYTIHGW